MTATAHFPAPSRLAGLRGLVILAFCAALAAAFVAETTWRPAAVEAGPLEFATREAPGQSRGLALSAEQSPAGIR